MTAPDSRDSVERIVAEMRARMKGPPMPPPVYGAELIEWADRLSAILHPTINIMCETKEGGVIGTTFLSVIRVDKEDDGAFTVVTDYWPK